MSSKEKLIIYMRHRQNEAENFTELSKKTTLVVILRHGVYIKNNNNDILLVGIISVGIRSATL